MDSERRFDPVAGVWRVFSDGANAVGMLPGGCSLCLPGVQRPEAAAGQAPPLAVIDLTTAAAGDAGAPPSDDRLFTTSRVLGATEAVVYDDRHDVSLADLTLERVARLLDVCADRYSELGRRTEVQYVLLLMAAQTAGSDPRHPHIEILASPDIPALADRELQVARQHLTTRGTCLHCDVVAHERAAGLRLLRENRHFLAFTPFAARFPYEVHVTSHRHTTSLLDLSNPERGALAVLIRDVARAYRTLFADPVPYVMAVHQSPTDDGQWLDVSHLHVEFTPLPPEVRDRAFGHEIGAGTSANPVPPEVTAAQLRAEMSAGSERD